MFTAGLDSYTPDSLVRWLSLARAHGLRVVLALTGGSHTNYLSRQCPGYQRSCASADSTPMFDPAKWGARMDAFTTPAIRSAIAAGVADGTILGASVMDEPQVTGTGDGNTWGPPGTMTKARVDSLCGAVQARFPTLVAGVVHRHDTFEASKNYATCGWIYSQYSTRLGTAPAFRDGGLAFAKRSRVAIMFGLNSLNGGTQSVRDGRWICDPQTTGGRGTYDPNCRMTPAQLQSAALTLGPVGCAFLFWRYDVAQLADPAIQQAFRVVADSLARVPAPPCRRS